MNISNLKKKFVASLLIVSFIFSGFTSYPKKAEALIPSVDPATAAIWVKEYVLDPIVFIATRFLIKGLVVSMTKWVDSGFDGAPLFATDPEGFLLDIGDNVMGDFIQSSGFGALCSPFQAQVKIALIAKYNNGKIRSRDPYQASCKLSSVSNNIQQFIKGNFNQGGWPAWLALTQEAQGNPYSALLDAQAQAEFRIGSEKGTKSVELAWAQGFINFSDCIQKNANGKCTQHGPTKTPGQVIASKLNTNLGSDLKTLEISDELSELLGAILNQVIGAVFTGSKALFSTSGTGTGGGSGGGGPGGGAGGPNFPTALGVYLIGPDPQHVQQGQPYLEYGAYATDPIDITIPSSNIAISGTVNVNVPGTYTITYTATNSQGNTAQATRTVIVDPPAAPPGGGGPSGAPIIVLNPPLTINVSVGSLFNDPGWSVVDSTGSTLYNLLSSVVVTGSVNTSVPGTYQLTYDVTDPATGQSASSVTRTVIVQ